MEPDVSALLEAAQCMTCLTDGQVDYIEAYLISVWAE